MAEAPITRVTEGFLALVIGCLECMEPSESLGVFPSYEAARAVLDRWFAERDAMDGDSFASWVLDLSAQVRHEDPAADRG